MRKIYRPKTSLAAIRTKLGLTQEQMALQLEVSKSVVKMVETCKRSLPHDAHIKLAHIEIKLTTITPSGPSQMLRTLDVAGITSGDQGARNIRSADHDRSYKIFMLEQKLKRMQQKHNEIIAIIQNLQALIDRSSAETGAPISHLINFHQNHFKKLLANGPQEQEKIMWQIAILKPGG